MPNFFKLPPDLYFGEGIGIATNSMGNLFVYHENEPLIGTLSNWRVQ